MRIYLCALASVHALYAGVVQGVVLEHASSHPLARTLVRLTPIQTTAQVDPGAMQMRTGPAGEFTFSGVAEGVYVLTASRRGYFDTGHNQRRPAGQSAPITVARDSSFFTQLRMYRMGAVTGRVIDQNDIGMAGVAVVAYRARLPLRAVGRGVTDDRGVYRVFGLGPGHYWVRNDAATLDDGASLLPTFGPESRDSQQARNHDARLDIDTADADIRPAFGNLFTFRGTIQCRSQGGTVSITLSSETGRRSGQASCGQEFTFSGMAPGAYEILAVKEGGEAGWIEFFADRDMAMPVSLYTIGRAELEIRRPGAAKDDKIPVTVIARRADLSETDAFREIAPQGALLTPGHWEFAAITGPGNYVESIVNRYSPRRHRLLLPEAWDVAIGAGMPNRITVTVADGAAHIVGRVMNEGAGVSGAPVMILPVSDLARRAMRGWQQVRCDSDGRFRFDSLAPGDYRVLASFDVTEPDESAMEEAHAATVRVAASQTVERELKLWTAP